MTSGIAIVPDVPRIASERGAVELACDSSLGNRDRGVVRHQAESRLRARKRGFDVEHRLNG